MKKNDTFPAFSLWVSTILLMVLPLILSFFPSISGEKLNGVSEDSLPEISFANYLNGSLQANANEYVRREIGLANYWTRAYNELNYRLFRYTNAEKVVLGKEDCFYEEMYITEYLGRNFIGEDLVREKVKALKQLQDLLKTQYDVELLLILEPGKASIYPEFIPARYHPENKTISNFSAFISACDSYKVDYLDLNSYFKQLKPTAPHKLYSKYGVHWSSYGLWLAADTLNHFIESKCGINLPEIIHMGDSNSMYNKDLDFDMEPSMNLLFPLPHEQMNFPICTFNNNPAVHQKPRVLTIADSYYWSIWNSGISKNLFSENLFWYYNRTVYPNIFVNIVWVDKSILKETIENHDIILLCITDANLYDFGWGFIEEALTALDPNYKTAPKIQHLNQIMAEKETYQELLKQAEREQVPFSKILIREIGK